ncbi:CBN-MSH-5 protein [Caenorhabditis brenneri]|uniref:CBN-MSH-5 protein n=1 Tax=Caenorhabditis brenneri TaxID=135651 RepID=G0P4Q5_CAEBE|nr:CBN-MSH-5 protein [Caenorhabditis brenneri]
MNPKEYRDETVLSLSFAQNMLGAAYYEQSTQLVKVMNDISEDHEFVFLKRYAQHEKLQRDANDKETTQETIPTWDASLAYSTDETSLQNENEDDDDEAFDGPPAMLYKLTNNFYKMPRALQRLKLMVGAEDSSMSDEDRYTIVRSFGALLLFLDETRLGVEKEPLSVTPPIKSIKTLTLENLVDIDYNTIQALDILPKELESKNVFQRFQSGTAKLIHWECFVSTVNALLEIISIVRQTPV